MFFCLTSEDLRENSSTRIMLKASNGELRDAVSGGLNATSITP